MSSAKAGHAKRLMTNLIVMVFILTGLSAALVSVNLHFVLILLIIAMLPGIIAYVVDSRVGHFASKSVIAFNFAGVAPQLAAVISSGSYNQTAQNLMANPSMWLLVYGFAAFGWVVVHLIPQITLLYLTVRAEFMVKKLQAMQESLVEEWGTEVK